MVNFNLKSISTETILIRFRHTVQITSINVGVDVLYWYYDALRDVFL